MCTKKVHWRWEERRMENKIQKWKTHYHVSAIDSQVQRIEDWELEIKNWELGLRIRIEDGKNEGRWKLVLFCFCVSVFNFNVFLTSPVKVQIWIVDWIQISNSTKNERLEFKVSSGFWSTCLSLSTQKAVRVGQKNEWNRIKILSSIRLVCFFQDS